jgi:hypothetical protein
MRLFVGFDPKEKSCQSGVLNNLLNRRDYLTLAAYHKKRTFGFVGDPESESSQGFLTPADPLDAEYYEIAFRRSADYMTRDVVGFLYFDFDIAPCRLIGGVNE